MKIRWFYPLGVALAITLALAGVLLSGEAVAQSGAVDHSALPQLAGPFEKPQDVTAACLTCHPDAATDVMKTVHWTWEYTDPITGQLLGKNNVVNNYCIGLSSNEPRCTSCHIGYGYKDNTFDFTVQNNVDCLVCHANVEIYKKFPAGAGMPVLGTEAKEFPAGSGKMWNPVDLAAAAQSVAAPTRANCGTCHFFGGGGDAVKHGDLDTTMGNPSPDLDVHMSPDTLNFACEACHQPDAHNIPGMIYNGEERVMCEDCHTGEKAPHASNPTLTQHTENIACQTCHIPAFARGEATKMSWDWSTAGERDDAGKPVIRKDEAGHIIYDGQKGTFTSEQNVKPYYQWWNGQTMFLTPADPIDPSAVVSMTQYQGERGDGKIFPFKRFTGKQPYDSVNNIMVVPNLFPNNPEDVDAYWKSYDWEKAISSGMAYAGYNYSGTYGWVETEFLWVQNHQVAPKENAVQCVECHTAESGRLDFAALGYTEAEVSGLTQFPPVLSQPEPTVEPTVEPTLEPTVEPTAVPEQPTAEPTAATVNVEPAEAEPQTSNTTTYVLIGLAVLVVAGVGYWLLRKK